MQAEVLYFGQHPDSYHPDIAPGQIPTKEQTLAVKLFGPQTHKSAVIIYPKNMRRSLKSRRANEQQVAS
jgi:hypothetical protein